MPVESRPYRAALLCAYYRPWSDLNCSYDYYQTLVCFIVLFLCSSSLRFHCRDTRPRVSAFFILDFADTPGGASLQCIIYFNLFYESSAHRISSKRDCGLFSRLFYALKQTVVSFIHFPSVTARNASQSSPLSLPLKDGYYRFSDSFYREFHFPGNSGGTCPCFF